MPQLYKSSGACVYVSADDAERTIQKVITNLVQKTVEYIMNTVKKIEVKPYVKAEVKATGGYRGAAEVKKFAGVDINTGSTELFSAKAELNPETKENPKDIMEFNYYNKDGKVTKTGGINVSIPLEGDAGAGAGFSVSNTKDANGNNSTTTSVNGGASVGPVNATLTGGKTVDTETHTNTRSVTGSVGHGGAFGLGVVGEYNIEVGVKVSLKTDE